MEYRSRRMKSLITGVSDLLTLNHPINKSIKPSQVYHDYYGESPTQNSYTPVIPKKHVSNCEIESHPLNCNCYSHKAPFHYVSASLVSTSHSGRTKISTPSPIKSTAKEVITKGSFHKHTNDNSMFPYGMPIIRKETPNQVKNEKYSRQISNAGRRIFY